MDLAPFTSVTGRFGFTQNRELIPTGALVQGQTARELIQSERTTIAGVDLGWVVARTINANLAFRPNLATWLPLQASADTRFRFGRGASFITEIEGDSVLTQDFGNGRNLRASVGMNLPVFLRSIAGSDRGGVLGALLGFFDRIDIFTANWDNSLSSSYDRTPAQPDFAYQVGLGGFEDFRVQDGDSARTVTEGEGVTLTSGFRFPLGAGLSVDYRTSEGTTWTPATQTDTRAETWPSVRLNWNRLPMPPFARAWIETFGIRTGYSVTTTGREIVNANQDRTSETKRLPFAVTLAFTGGWTFSYGLDLTNEERVDATGSTFGDATSHSIQIGGRIKMPAGGRTFTNPLRLSLRLSQTQRAECRQLGTGTLTPELEMGVGGLDCQPFTDLRIRRIDLTADTDLPPFVIGLQGSWRDTQSEIGQRPGSTQLDISLFGQFLLETGEIR